MKINYEDIITKANERKEKLQALSNLCEDLPMWRGRFADSLGYFSELLRQVNQLDPEGRALISPHLEGYRAHFANALADVKRCSTRGVSSSGELFNNFLDTLK